MNLYVINFWKESVNEKGTSKCSEKGTSKSRMEKIFHEIFNEIFDGNSLQTEKQEANGHKNTIILWGASEFIKAAREGRLKNQKILFTVELDSSGFSEELTKALAFMQEEGSRELFFDGSVGGLIVDGKGELYTKDMARRLVFAANRCGLTFLGRPLVEATGSLNNFMVQSRNLGLSLEETYVSCAKNLIKRLSSFEDEGTQTPKILVVHASSRKTSNSIALWEMVKSKLPREWEIEEVSIRNGQVWDCRGCKYEDCLHLGENSSCFYGGVMVDKVYPAILKCNALVLICPNYNDAISANIMACINRLTALFRSNDFSRKKVFGIIVSGYSGSDIVCQQIISAMNMNKNFILPGNFAIMETGNDPGSVINSKGILERSEAFARSMEKSLKNK